MPETYPPLDSEEIQPFLTSDGITAIVEMKWEEAEPVLAALGISKQTWFFWQALKAIVEANPFD